MPKSKQLVAIGCRLECPFCGHRWTSWSFVNLPTSVCCPECDQQSVYRNGQCINDTPCPEEFHCLALSGLGFVPETGCPVHDMP